MAGRKKQKVSSKISKKYTTHRSYYLDTAENVRDLNPRSRAEKRDAKYQEISDKVNAHQKKKEDRAKEEQRRDIIDKLNKELKTGSKKLVVDEDTQQVNYDNIYEVGPSSYDLLLNSFKNNNTDKKRKKDIDSEEEEEVEEEEEEEEEEQEQEDDNQEEGDIDISEEEVEQVEQDDQEDEDDDEDDVVPEDDERDIGDDDYELNDDNDIVDQDNEEEVDGDDQDEDEDAEEEEEEEEEKFEDVYGIGDRHEDEQIESRASLKELERQGRFQINKKKGDAYQMHFNRDNITEWSQLDDMVDNNKAMEGQSVELETFGVMTSTGCPSYITLKSKQTKSSLPEEKKSFQEYNIKDRLLRPWSLTKKSKDNDLYFTMIQQCLFPVMNEYRDLLFTEETSKNHRSIYQLYTLHAVNHILKSRDQLMEDNVITKEAEEKGGIAPDLRHQGFTKPKVLIIVPFRNTALDIIKLLLKLAPHQQQDAADKKTRVIKEFSQSEDEPPMNPTRPDDYKYTFRDNIDDCFRMGVSFKKKGVQLYQPFFFSDLIIATPLGLRLVVGTEGDKQRDYDFLSSIEMVIVDQVESILQQNWDHMNIIFDNLNRTPKKDHATDFSRIRIPTLEGWGKYFRQTLIFGSINTPEINSLFNRQCFNVSGKIRIKKIKEGEINNIIPELIQTFHRVHISRELEGDDSLARLQFLTTSLLPKFADSDKSKGVLVFIPNYTEFVTLRNLFKKETKSYVAISEYLGEKEDRKSRALFYKGDKTFMLFSERYHYFKRLPVRGIKHVVFFGLPQNPHFYSELLNMVTQEKGTVMTLYTNKDKLALERVVGSVRCANMMESEKVTHLFC